MSEKPFIKGPSCQTS